MKATLVALTIWQALTCLEYSWKAADEARIAGGKDIQNSEEVAWNYCLNRVDADGVLREALRANEGENY